jgi:hypothetical protein
MHAAVGPHAPRVALGRFDRELTVMGEGTEDLVAGDPQVLVNGRLVVCTPQGRLPTA